MVTEQANNRRNNVYATHNGETLTLSQWADRFGVAANKLAGPIHRYQLAPDEVVGAIAAAPHRRARWKEYSNVNRGGKKAAYLAWFREYLNELEKEGEWKKHGNCKW